jgi:hypothetical protein
MDPEGPKTYGSGFGSVSATLVPSQLYLIFPQVAAGSEDGIQELLQIENYSY